MQPSPKGILYLLPVALGEEGLHAIPEYLKNLTEGITHFVVENERSARRYLRATGYKANFDEGWMRVLDEHTPATEVPALLQPCFEGHDIALLSEAGCPAIADPGAALVRIAHEKGIQVKPLVGPSSILLALMGAGMNGQSFCFNGYLPVDLAAQKKRIKHLEQLSGQGQTQIFMETPYRNNRMIQSLLETCMPDTRLCIACDLTLPTEYIKTDTIAGWKKQVPDIHKRPVIFVLSR
jgi:16S rRNA (cytidine1402-2'-O)-methyltransferase